MKDKLYDEILKKRFEVNIEAGVVIVVGETKPRKIHYTGLERRQKVFVYRCEFLHLSKLERLWNEARV